MVQLEQRRGFLDLHYALCSICRTFPNRGSIFPNELADGILLRMAVQTNQHFPSRILKERTEREKFEGAYVMDPVVGYHENVQVPDFASLYPSIILSWNMSPDTLVENDSGQYRTDCAFAAATGRRFVTDHEGIIPMAVRQLIQKRKEYKVRAEAFEVNTEDYKNMTNLSTAVKVATNSFYGLLGNEGSRYYEREVARSVTLTGQFLIRKIIEYFENRGFQCVYGDTDSVFVKCDEAEMSDEIERINARFLPELLDKYGCRECAVRLDFDKGFKNLLLVTKKRYVGKLSLVKGRHTDDDMPPEVKGLEVQRSDQIRYSQDMLREFFTMLLDNKADANYIGEELRKRGHEFFTADLPLSSIEITESVSRHPTDYKVKTPAVKVAEAMIARGDEFFVGMKIPYVVLGHKPTIQPIHASEYTGVCDRKYYWEKRILPPIQRLITARFPEHDFSSFQNPQQVEMDWDMPVKPRKVRKAKKVKKAVKVPIATVRIPASCGKAYVKGISKLTKAYPGKYKLKVIIEVDEPHADVTVDTDEKISKECLELIIKNFEGVSITPKLI